MVEAVSPPYLLRSYGNSLSSYLTLFDSIKLLMSRTNLIFAYSTVGETSNIQNWAHDDTVIQVDKHAGMALTCPEGCVTTTAP
jgi:hypothetical protein